MSDEDKRNAQILAVINTTRMVTDASLAETCAILIGAIIVVVSNSTSTSAKCIAGLQVAIDSLTLAQQIEVARSKPEAAATSEGN